MEKTQQYITLGACIAGKQDFFVMILIRDQDKRTANNLYNVNNSFVRKLSSKWHVLGETLRSEMIVKHLTIEQISTCNKHVATLLFLGIS